MPISTIDAQNLAIYSETNKVQRKSERRTKAELKINQTALSIKARLEHEQLMQALGLTEEDMVTFNN
ncbi:hypothetical protein FM037_13295 [Shewanella psychropiezotolerans]|uniref:Uncharacterized protein n=1 Tax=Shewanella psychropiezotolerans TaxID=2593655 RepID=A0ABX5X0T1_9GAMM|nr:hypothetical protein [Shewanella psychropiezotolerans]QDO84037.1 hypothetical protein FM037_13295 [Shewanella psychropiezotolerans]